MHVALVTLFPEYFDGPLSASIVGRGVQAGHLTFSTHSPRDVATDRHRTVDDTPYGGGAGMLMRATEIAAAVQEAKAEHPDARVVLMSPQGRTLDHALARSLARSPSMIVVCPRYEGVDERFIERYVDVEVSIGDYVLTGGEPAAVVLIDAVSRHVPGVLGNDASLDEESFAAGALEYPQFTRPAAFEGLDVPAVLVSGDHARVARWRRKASLLRTRARRPDLFAKLELTDRERAQLDDAEAGDAVPKWMIRARHGEDAT